MAEVIILAISVPLVVLWVMSLRKPEALPELQNEPTDR